MSARVAPRRSDTERGGVVNSLVVLGFGTDIQLLFFVVVFSFAFLDFPFLFALDGPWPGTCCGVTDGDERGVVQFREH